MNTSRIIYFVFNFWLLFFVSSPCLGEQNVGAKCVVERGGENGRCQLLKDCPVIQNEKSLNNQPNKCNGDREYEDIVCCPNTESAATAKRTSQKKCEEYQLVVKVNTEIVYLTGEAAFRETKEKCESEMAPLVVGGEAAKSKEFPHMVAIGYGDGPPIKWACGGSLISKNFVLTAAHCVDHINYGPAQYVLLGDLIIDSEIDIESRPIIATIAQIFPHPDFDNLLKHNDIALLLLDQEIDFNDIIRPACLANSNSDKRDYIKGIATGWGANNNALMKVTLDLFSNDKCNRAYKAINSSEVIVDRLQICAGSNTTVRDTCHGDSGGPLQVIHPLQSCMYEIIGVTSFGRECGSVQMPAIYTSVFSYLDWIEGIVWPNQ